jgi:hypothetical protein
MRSVAVSIEPVDGGEKAKRLGRTAGYELYLVWSSTRAEAV